MTAIKEYVSRQDGYQLHFVKSNKFKTNSITVKLKAPLNRDTITCRALLPYVLNQGTNNYPGKQELQRKLDDLYGSVLGIGGSKKGEHHIITIRMELANRKFIPDNLDIMNEGIDLVHDILYNPFTKDNRFDESIFNREKDTLKQKINVQKDDKMNYANMRLIDEMCKGEKYQLHVHGYEEDLELLSNEDLYSYYEKMIQSDQMNIYVHGDFDEKEVTKKFAEVFQREGSTASEEGAPENHQTVKQKEVIEKEEIQQAKLHIGYRTNITYRDADYFALQVFNGLFGGFPSSKLFINVREKNSLAYYAASRLESQKGLLLVFSGIAPEDFEKARDIIKQQMEAMKDGDFTEEEVTETKELIVNQLLETMDHPQGIIELLYQQVLGGITRSPEELIENIKKVTKRDVIDAANKIEEDTLYLLTREGGISHA
ncbi:EF-P 5-aminopentanol modification-associated protein YfmF [Virgibacillus kimchii]